VKWRFYFTVKQETNLENDLRLMVNERYHVTKVNVEQFFFVVHLPNIPQEKKYLRKYIPSWRD